MAPTSYQPPTRGDAAPKKTFSQSASSALQAVQTPVSAVLAEKGGEIFTIGPDDTIHNAVNLLGEKRIGALLVTDPAGELIGVLSERDIVRKMADIPGRTLQQLVSTLMTTNSFNCSPEDPIMDVLTGMTENRCRHVPVLENGKLLGIITIGDIVHFRLKELEYESLKMKQMIIG
ncbi:MAG: CBS domain-containing protein [Gammaproteobacteria bacterium]